MESELTKRINKATEEFRKKISDATFVDEVPLKVEGEEIEIPVTKERIMGSRSKICPIRTNADQFIEHFKDIEKYLPLCSSKESFSMSKDFTQKKVLDKHDTYELTRNGAQLIPIRSKDDQILYHHEGGVKYGTSKIGKGLIYAIRHNEGNYEDSIDDLGHFYYYPPSKRVGSEIGFLRYRWNQFLKQKFEIPIFFLAIRWFKIEKEIAPNTNYVFMISPVTIVSTEEQKDKKTFFKAFGNTENIGETIGDPLPLRIISVKEAINVVYDLNILNNTKQIFGPRQRLSSRDEKDWAYNNINTTARGRQIKKWARKNGKKCPDGSSSKCQNKLFDKIPLKQIQFGHIVSQKWCGSFKFDEIRDHPYNLYLTCSDCNRILQDRFPHKKLQDKIDTEKATIGDWIKEHKSTIERTT